MNSFDDILNNAPAEERPQLSKEEYAEKKKAERDAIFELSDNTALEVAGDGATFQSYLDVQSKFDRYSAVNALLILAQEPDATRVGDFNFWKEKGGYVRKGESGISILEPHPYTKDDGTPGTGYNLKKVFDISQVDTRKVQAPTPPPTYTKYQILQALVSKAPMKITGVDELPNNLCAMTDPQTGEISVRRGMEFSRTFSALAQCIAAAELAAKSDSQIEPGFSDCCVSYMLCKKYGVDTEVFRFDDAPDMFNGMKAQDVKGKLSQIRDAAENISARMERQFDAISKAAKNQDAR